MFELGLLLRIRKDLLLTDKTIDISNVSAWFQGSIQVHVLVLSQWHCNVMSSTLLNTFHKIVNPFESGLYNTRPRVSGVWREAGLSSRAWTRILGLSLQSQSRVSHTPGNSLWSKPRRRIRPFVALINLDLEASFPWEYHFKFKIVSVKFCIVMMLC